jgi:hypothetical protein
MAAEQAAKGGAFVQPDSVETGKMEDISAEEGQRRYEDAAEEASEAGEDLSRVRFENTYAVRKGEKVVPVSYERGRAMVGREGYKWVPGMNNGGQITIFRGAVATGISRVLVGEPLGGLERWHVLDYGPGARAGAFFISHELGHNVCGEIEACANRYALEWGQ